MDLVAFEATLDALSEGSEKLPVLPQAEGYTCGDVWLPHTARRNLSCIVNEHLINTFELAPLRSNDGLPGSEAAKEGCSRDWSCETRQCALERVHKSMPPVFAL